MPLAGGAADVLADLPGAPEFSREIAGDTAFDASPRHAWRAGFRECAMLTHGCDYGRITTDQAAEWLQAWTEIGRGPYGRWARQGAADGIAFARETGDDAAEWAQINDPHWSTLATDTKKNNQRETGWCQRLRDLLPGSATAPALDPTCGSVVLRCA
ncbi:hypothetical protein [Saccharopolyspora hattusasensis]|uniref:hypothetical protein n=1 Tax=Saccharopolyspora hattusasensis TaxID=1128679 RepID=UPI003D96C2AD